MNKIEFITICESGWWKPYILKLNSGGISIAIDVDIEFPMISEDNYLIKKGKKYKVVIEEIE